MDTNAERISNMKAEIMKAIWSKGVLKQEKREVYYYSALVSEADYIKSKTMTLVEKVFDGDAKGLLSAYLSYKEVSTEDLEWVWDISQQAIFTVSA